MKSSGTLGLLEATDRGLVETRKRKGKRLGDLERTDRVSWIDMGHGGPEVNRGRSDPDNRGSRAFDLISRSSKRNAPILSYMKTRTYCKD